MSAARSIDLHPRREETNPTKLPTHVRDSHILVRERRFPPSQDIAALMKFLRDMHSTGTLMINISQGGICTLRYREEINVTEP